MAHEFTPFDSAVKALTIELEIKYRDLGVGGGKASVTQLAALAPVSQQLNDFTASRQIWLASNGGDNFDGIP